jgi:hypothetical protein
MDEIERTERGIDEINRAADILREVVTAFGDTMRPHERSALLAASRDAIAIARELDKAADAAREREGMDDSTPFVRVVDR